MDDLISRKAALDAVKDEWIGCPSDAYPVKVIIEDTQAAIERIPSVPAVPLNELCELLSSMYRCPSSGFPSSGRVCSPYCSDKLMKKLCGSDCEKFTDAERWKMFLTEWMEGQDAAD